MKFLIMLEDDVDRIRRFQAIVCAYYPAAVLKVARTADSFKAIFSSLESVPDLICLDHDLIAGFDGEPDPGDGRDVSNFLVSHPAICPVLIHSSNSAAANSMLYELREAAWNVERISPLGDRWIEEYWFPTALHIIAQNDRKGE